MRAVDGKQEINLEWPNSFSLIEAELYFTTLNAIYNVTNSSGLHG